MDNVFLLKKKLGNREIREVVKERLKPDSEIKVGFSYSNAREYKGSTGIYTVKNEVNIELNPSQFKLFKDFRLEDIDGCKEKKNISPNHKNPDRGKCTLEFYSEDASALYEITYEENTIYIN